MVAMTRARDKDMDELGKDADFLRGKQVAFAGKLASMTRKEAEKLVEEFGGNSVVQVNRQTSFLILGRDGLLLRKDGRISRKLLKAQLLQRRGHLLDILSEEELLARLRLESRSTE